MVFRSTFCALAADNSAVERRERGLPQFNRANSGQGRPAVLLDMVYFAAANLSREDLESLA